MAKTKKSLVVTKEKAQPAASAPIELSAPALHRLCNPNSLGFHTTDELDDLQNVIGQPRALRALELGSEVNGPGYNIFVLGAPGSGRTTLSQEYLQRKAANEATPDDWCYVNNFDDPHSPRALRLPAGHGVELRKDLREMVEYCQQELPRAFESEEYIHERDQLVNELNKSQEAEFFRLQQYAEKFSFLIARTPVGIVLAPASQGKPLEPEEVEKLSPEQRTKLEQLQDKLSEEVQKALKHLRELGKTTAEQLRTLTQRTAAFHIQHLKDELKEKYAGIEPVLNHLENVYRDIIDNAGQFQSHEEENSPQLGQNPDWLQRYDVNVLVDNTGLKGAPVIVEMHPVYHTLLGRVEHEVIMGATRTDFTMIRPGTVHRANGGYLILPARDLLTSPYAWDGLKRALRDGCLRITDLGSQLGLLSTEMLEPEPIPLQLKIILVGSPILYYLLQAYEEDFGKLFKVRAEFTTLMERDAAAEHEYGLFVKSVVMDNKLPPFDSGAVARIIEFSARLAENQDKLSTRFGHIADLVREAAYWAKKMDSNRDISTVTAAAVQRAIDEAIYRTNLMDDHLQEMILNDTLMIDVSGSAIGRINALSVYSLGDYAFGKPTRISVVVSPGRAGVIDIERMAHLGGPIHTKGVLILSGYLNSHYGRSRPLSLSASLTFEQSYGEVEGDSASAAELFTLLSAIANIPLRQDLAITGSINQHGQIQAIGGVNEKIEGFFNVCNARGLTGSQGVLIPKANQRHLMLRAEVSAAVEQGKFHIWTFTTVEEGLALFTGLPIDELQTDGAYPEGTLNYYVMKRLEEFEAALDSEDNNTEKTPDDEVDEQSADPNS